MTEPPIALREMLQGLAEHQVEYVLFGIAGALFYGYLRTTEDADFVVRPTRQNMDRVHDWLVSIDAHLKLRPARRFGSRERWGMQKGSNATVLTKLGQVDLVQQIPGMPPWDELIADAEVYDVDGLTVPVMNRRTLIEMKRRRGSRQDLVDIEAIELLDEL